VITPRIFSTSAALQDYLLKEAGPGSLVVTPHRRLAQQLWQRQRREQIQAGRAAWEPLPLKTFQGWLHDLFTSLWPEVAVASGLRRLSLWRRAIEAAPPLAGTAADLAWAQGLDETYNILCRHLLVAGRDARPTEDARSTGDACPTGDVRPADDAPLMAWRRQVTRIFSRLLAEGGWLAPGELPAYLLARLQEGKISLPGQIMVVGLESPAAAEGAFLTAVARRTHVTHLQVRGDPAAVKEAVVLPDRGQELAWVAARLLELAARDGLPLHRLAVTAMDMEHYGPQLQRIFAELLGPAQTPGGWAYNFSQGPRLSETPLFLAALLPLKFITGGERREDLVSLLLSPFYGGLSRQREQTAPWDRVFREQRLDLGWQNFRQAIAHDSQAGGKDLLPRLDRIWASLQTPGSGREWRRRLEGCWREMEFTPAAEAEQAQWGHLLSLFQELDATLGGEPLEAGEFLAWLEHGAKKVPLPGPGLQAAGVQVLGLLEMRGLDFSRIFCLGMNSGTFPPPPRPLPLLTAAERRAVLGGTYQSQHAFSRELYDTLLGAAPELTLTRPRVADDEERVGSPLYLGPWEPQEMAVLSRPHPAWLRSPAVRAAFTAVEGTAVVVCDDGPLSVRLPSELSLSKTATALSCPCRFLLEIILRLKELPEIEAGLDPRERGDRLHKVLARFTRDFQKFLEEHDWDQERAQEMLIAAAHQVLGALLQDVHWRAELERWLGETAPGRSLLQEWLLLEQQRHEQGWRWRLMESAFAGLTDKGWPFAVKGRLDRLDYHPETRQAVIWDYKSGEVPGAGRVFDDLQEFQLPCYLLAVERGLTEAPRERRGLKAGFIGLKSTREKHLKHEEFEARAEEWPRVAAALVSRLQDLGRRLAAGDFRPDPNPAPEGKNLGACKYCPYALLCGFSTTPAEDEGGEPD
jgi:RecB family exonuclease